MSDDAMTSEELKKHAAFVRSLAKRLVRNPADADDIEQDIWLAAVQDPSRTAHSSIRRWFIRVGKNLAIARGRKNAKRPTSLIEEPQDQRSIELDVHEREEAIQGIMDGVRRLPINYKELVLLRFYEDLTVPQIAKRLDLTKATVRHRLNRAMELLKQDLPMCDDKVNPNWRHDLGLMLGFSVAPLLTSTTVTSKGLSLMALKSKANVVLATIVILAVGLFSWYSFELDESESLTQTEVELDSRTAQVRRASKNTKSESATLGPNEPNSDTTTETVSTLPPGQLRLEFVWANTGAPAKDVVLYFSPSSRYERQVRRTDQQGFILFDKTPQENFWVAKPYTKQSSFTTIKKGTTGSLKVELPIGVDVTGEVSREDGTPVGNARVMVGQGIPFDAAIETVRTDSDGKFFIPQVPLGANIGVVHDTLAPAAPQAIRDIKEQAPHLEFILKANASFIKGRVLDDRGFVVEGAIIKAGDPKAPSWESNGRRGQFQAAPAVTRSAKDGTFVVGPLCPGRNRLRIGMKSKTVARFDEDFTLDPGATKEVEVTLETAPIVYGVVKDEHGQPLKGVFVSTGIQDRDFGWDTGLTSTDRNGRYELVSHSTGDIRIQFGWRNAFNEKTVLKVEGGKRYQLDREFKLGARITGKLAVPEGVTKLGWRISAKRNSQIYFANDFRREIYTDDSGEFAFSRCPDYEILLVVSHQDLTGGMPVIKKAVQATDGHVVLVIREEDLPSAGITGQVKAASKVPLDNVSVSIRPKHGGIGLLKAIDDPNGTFAFSRLPKGQYDLTIQSRKFGERKIALNLEHGEERDLGEIMLENLAEITFELSYPNSDKKRFGHANVSCKTGGWFQLQFDGTKTVTHKVSPGTYEMVVLNTQGEQVGQTITFEVKADQKKTITYQVKDN